MPHARTATVGPPTPRAARCAAASMPKAAPETTAHPSSATPPDSDAVASVRSDDEHGVGLAVDHLVGLGHRRIAHVDGGGASSATERRRGFLRRMAEHGLAGSAVVVAGGDAEADGARAMTDLLAAPVRPTAVVAFNDRCARGILDTAAQHGLAVPADLSVVGYDDSVLAVVQHLTLTTVAQDAAELARSAVAAAVRLAEEGTAQAVVLRPALVVRETTGPAGV